MAKINKEKQAAMPQKVLHELFEYDGTTGGWTNKTNRNSRARKGQVAGCLDKRGYVVIRINGRLYKAHRLAWVYVYGDYPNGKQPFIDHTNGKRDDNRIENLKVSSYGENQRNQKMHSRNISGVVGVHRYDIVRPSGKIDGYWRASWCNESGKLRSKCFPLSKLGEEQAKQMAIDYRVEQIRLLEQNFGIIYSNRHGT